MKITHIDLYSNAIKVATMDFKNFASARPYNATAVLGLDAEEIVPRYYGKGKITGKKFYDLTLNGRVITMRVTLNPNFALGQSYSDLRDDLYRATHSSRDGVIQFVFMDGGAEICGISGFVSKFEAALFSPTPEIQMTVRCEDGMLKGLTPIAVDIDALSVTDPVIMDANSTAPHGMKFVLSFDDPAQYFEMSDSATPDWTFRVTPGDFQSELGFLGDGADVLHFSSDPNDRYVYLIRQASEFYYMIDKIQIGSIWPIMFPMSNTFHIDTGGADFTWESFEYTETYWGV